MGLLLNSVLCKSCGPVVPLFLALLLPFAPVWPSQDLVHPPPPPPPLHLQVFKVEVASSPHAFHLKSSTMLPHEGAQGE